MPRALAAALLLTSCAHAPAAVDRTVLEAVQRSPGAFVSGTLTGLSEPWVLEDRDFAYAIGLAPDGSRAAFSVLRAPETKLVLSRLAPLVPESAVASVNRYEYDVESVDFSPDGSAVVTVSRDGAVRAFTAEDGKATGVYVSDEPLVSVAFHPSGRFVFAGSARGTVTALHFPSLVLAADARLHTDEVRGLAVGPQGTLYSASWDKTVAATSTAEAAVVQTSARFRYEKEGTSVLVRGMVNGRAAGAFALDARSPHVFIHSTLARAAGIDPAALTELLNLPTALGTTVARVARGQSLTLKALRFTDVPLVVCDSCLPPGAHVVLGAPVMANLDVRYDDATSELTLALKPSAPQPEPAPTLVLGETQRSALPGALNDVTVDRAGKVLGVAMSHEKAERTVAGRDREKRGLKPPASPDDAGLRLDARTFAVLDKWNLHEGVVSTAAVSPDGKTLVTGGWDNQLLVVRSGEVAPSVRRSFGWILRRVRFSRDGRLLAVAAWTPPKPSQTQHSDPAAVVYEVGYDNARVEPGS